MAHIEQELIDVRKDEQLDLGNVRSYLENNLKLAFNNLTSFQFSGGRRGDDAGCPRHVEGCLWCC